MADGTALKSTEVLADYFQQNLLVIPQALNALSDIKLVAKNEGCAIYYKDLARDLTNVEFSTNQLCLVFIEQGQESLTTADNQTLSLNCGDAILLARGQHLHSDFVRYSKDLKAWLVFFGADLIEQHLASIEDTKLNAQQASTHHSYLSLRNSALINTFFTQVKQYQMQDVELSSLLKHKLFELLHLIEHVGCDSALHNLLNSHAYSASGKRNLKRLLQQDTLVQLSVADLAKLSGRSLSGFNRDFKAIYQQTPKRWLLTRRLCYAKKQLLRGEASVTDIAIDVGYGNVSHFIKAYKAHFGVTPKQQMLNE
ncbi:helix-turn-helix transcriptional regulator [Catenovulum sp. SM1970]|uniref:helix-turn-helix transcriptional regulator n=1 Tax=Marinifaba aquimaris TaxID=2741323 RepID=UPI001573E553|nr:helix-turn-helix transcriptional regulator [Marinifaba aquimaris]NTS75795.1 helix-turn-helix transcriptional regulator [Marinifaba aquimaris]